MFKRPFRRRGIVATPESLARRRAGARRRFFGGLATLAVLIAFTIWAIPRLDRIASVSHAAKATVADGDTLTLGAERIRLKGVDAPEFSQTCMRAGASYACGREARGELVRLIGQRTVVCEGWERDKYGRLLAACRACDADLNRALVENGWAVSYGGYQAEEAAAKAARRGLWAGDFDRPSAWRAAHGDAAGDEHTAFAALLHALKVLLGLS